MLRAVMADELEPGPRNPVELESWSYEIMASSSAVPW